MPHSLRRRRKIVAALKLPRPESVETEIEETEASRRLSKLYRAYAEGSALEPIALKATTVMSILLLQKPSRNSKSRDHSACLERRLRAWTEGDINNLILEGRTLQNRLPKISSSTNDEKNLVRAFSNLMFKGKTLLPYNCFVREEKVASCMPMIPSLGATLVRKPFWTS